MRIGDKVLVNGSDYLYHPKNFEVTIYGRSISGNITINATAKLNRYEIKVKLNGGESFDRASAGIESIELNGNEITTNTIQIKPETTCTFKVNLLDHWKLQGITYNLGGTGGSYTSDTFELTPTGDGYIDIITRERDSYTVTFDSNGGTGDMNPQAFIEGVEQEISANKFTKDGYVFKGWNTKADGSGDGIYDGERITIYSNSTIYAQWKEKKIPSIVEKISVNFKNMTNLMNISDEEMTAFEFIVIDKELLNISNSEFKVYNKEGKLLFTVNTENGDIALAEGLTSSDNILYPLTEEEIQQYAQFRVERIPKQIELIFAEEVKTYNVVFDANGGKFSNGDNTLNFANWNNDEYDYNSIIKPTRDGFTFKGYYTAKTGGTTIQLLMAEVGVDKDMTFYAQWEENSAGLPGIPEGGEQEDNNTGNTDPGNTNTDNTNTGNTNTNKPTGNNPQTGDNIVLFVVISLIAVVGIAATIKIKKYVK